MISYEHALDTILKHSEKIQLKTRALSLISSVGRILAEDIYSPESIPAADNSAMDGYLVVSEEVSHASKESPVRLKILGTLPAGKSSDFHCSAESTVEIMTGAILPESRWDAVVKIEDVVVHDDQTISVLSPVCRGTNVRPKATDFKQGHLVLKKWTVLEEKHVLALAALGIDNVATYEPLKVAILSTGDEIVPYTKTNLSLHQVRNSTSPYLEAFLNKRFCQARWIGHVPDSPEMFNQLMKLCLEDCYDLIITTGAVSMGKWDFISSALGELNFKTHFHKVAIRPGKPILFAESSFKRTLFFGLPGNPISSAVGAQFFVLPAILKLFHQEQKHLTARLSSEVRKPDGLKCFYKSVLSFNPIRGYEVQVVDGQQSYLIHSHLKSNCWVELDSAGDRVDTGTSVRVNLFNLDLIET